MLNMNKIGFFPYTPATQMLHGLAEGIAMLHEEGSRTCSPATNGLPRRPGARCAPGGWRSCAAMQNIYSPTVTAVMLPEGHDADAFRNLALETFNISYGSSFGRLCRQVFPHRPSRRRERRHADGCARHHRDGARAVAGIPHRKGGVQAAVDYLISAHASPARAAAE